MKLVETIIKLLLVVFISVVQAEDEVDSKIFYFGYASNLLEKRIRIENPSAERYEIGELNNYRLDFYDHSERWNGATATIVDDEGGLVWGAIWTINSSHIDLLDRGEGVHTGQYQALNVPIKVKTGQIIDCRAYQLVNSLITTDLSFKPSKSYKEVIIEGAIESGLPLAYIMWLNSIESTDNLATESLLRALGKL